MSGNPEPGIKCGAGKLRLGILARLGSPGGKGISPKKYGEKGQLSKHTIRTSSFRSSSIMLTNNRFDRETCLSNCNVPEEGDV